MTKMRKTFAYNFAFWAWYFRTFVLSHFRIVSIRSPVFRRPPSVSGIVLTKLFISFSSTFRYMQYIYTSARRFVGCRSKKNQFSLLICELCVSRGFRQSTNETQSSHFGSQFSSSQVLGSQFAIISIPIKGFTAKKSVVLNNDEPRPVPIPKDFAHLMIRKIDQVCLTYF